MENLLKNLVLDYWYKMLILVSVILLITSLTVPLQVIPNGSLALMSVGGFLIGMGELVNHPYQEAVDPYMRFKISGHMRKPCPGGMIAVGCGALAVLAGLAVAVTSLL